MKECDALERMSDAQSKNKQTQKGGVGGGWRENKLTDITPKSVTSSISRMLVAKLFPKPRAASETAQHWQRNHMEMQNLMQKKKQEQRKGEEK